MANLLVLVATLAALVPAAAAGQSLAGTLSGQVIDVSGSPVPGAALTIADRRSGLVRETFTDESGRYRFDGLPPGAYTVSVALEGFDPAAREVELGAGVVAVVDITLDVQRVAHGVVVTARRVEEVVQEVPIPVSVLDGTLIANTGSFNVNRVKELIPSVQFYSSNPRNSAVTIRGIGSPFGLTNDGIEPGVGLYVDGVFHARPAAATLDFLDLERVEVLRGPQGTLFGKNTTAGAINLTSRRPGFTRETDVELAYGSSGFVQGKASISGPLNQAVAARLSFSGTGRDGFLLNTTSGSRTNSLHNVGVRGQVLLVPSTRLSLVAAVDHTRQRPDGYAQAIAGVAPTMRPADRQFPQIAADLGYVPPSFNAFDRVVDTDAPWQSNQDLGGASLTAEWQVGAGRVISATAWRFWNWDPSNDRDFTGLSVTSVSEAPSRQTQWTQEVRYAGSVSPRVQVVTGLFAFRQAIDSDPTFRQEHGEDAARFLLPPTPLAATPGLLDGYGFTQELAFRNVSAAAFGQVEWSITDRLRLLPGLRLNYDRKRADFDQRVYGGLQTTDPALLALQRSVLAPQAYEADVADTNTSGQLTLAYRMASRVNGYATYSTGFKSVGLNLNGLPTDALGRPVLEAAVVRPERVRHVEVGVKTEPLSGVTANVTVFDTGIRDFQTQVVNAQVGVLRGYLANADKVRVRGAELDGSARIANRLTIHGAAAFTDASYVSFPDAPPPLEETGGPPAKDVSGSVLPGVSRWAFTVNGEYARPATVWHRAGEVFGGLDASYRSAFSSSPSASRYLVVNGYSVLNARVGIRWQDGWSVFVWSRNLLNTDYYEFLNAVPGNSGLYVGLPGDPRTVGVTLRIALRPRN